MKKLLLILGIILIIVGIVSLIVAGLNWYAFMNVLDGSASLYNRLHMVALIALIIGIILATIGFVFIILYKKM